MNGFLGGDVHTHTCIYDSNSSILILLISSSYFPQICEIIKFVLTCDSNQTRA